MQFQFGLGLSGFGAVVFWSMFKSFSSGHSFDIPFMDDKIVFPLCRHFPSFAYTIL